MKIKKNTPDAPKIESGLIQLIRIGKSTWLIWVKPRFEKNCLYNMRSKNNATNQPAHPRSLTSTFIAYCAVNRIILNYILGPL